MGSGARPFPLPELAPLQDSEHHPEGDRDPDDQDNDKDATGHGFLGHVATEFFLLLLLFLHLGHAAVCVVHRGVGGTQSEQRPTRARQEAQRAACLVQKLQPPLYLSLASSWLPFSPLPPPPPWKFPGQLDQ